MIKVDLHTHSIISPDGSLTEAQYKTILTKHVLDCVAITDHNDTTFAQMMQQKYGNKIIIGEEISTSEGEIIGLFLTKTIPSGLTAQQTITEIKKQQGLVYVPHPFETLRKGLQLSILENIVADIDIVEVFNGRGRFRGKVKEAEIFVTHNQLVGAASSDAHNVGGIGRTFTMLTTLPTRLTLKKLLQEGKVQRKYASILSYLTPKMNMLHKFVKKKV